LFIVSPSTAAVSPRQPASAGLRAVIKQIFYGITIRNTVILNFNQFPLTTSVCPCLMDIYVVVFCPFGNYKPWP